MGLLVTAVFSAVIGASATYFATKPAPDNSAKPPLVVERDMSWAPSAPPPAPSLGEAEVQTTALSEETKVAVNEPPAVDAPETKKHPDVVPDKTSAPARSLLQKKETRAPESPEEGEGKVAEGGVRELIDEADRRLGILDIGGAERLYKEALAKDKSSGEAWYGLGRVSQERSDYETARKRMETAIQKRNKALWRINLGTVLERLGRKDSAVAQWKSVLAEFPENRIAVKTARLHLERNGVSIQEGSGNGE